MTVRTLLAFILLTACAGSSERAEQAGSARDAGVAPAPPPRESGETKPSSQPGPTVGTPTGVRPPPSPGGAPPPDGAAPAPGAPAGALVPPPTPGALSVRLAGCVTAVDEAAARRFTPPPARPEAPPGVTVEGVQGGVHVVHELTHACCLRAEISSRLEGERLVVIERLAGEPCRCQCASTLETAVGAPPGRHEVVVILERPRSEPERVHEGVVEVR